MSFKIAYAAGHCLTTAGKRLPKALDPNETREWVLNDRVARYFAEAAAQYEGVELLRLDDPTGKAGNPVATRAKKANEWDADFLIEFHHNAGINLGSGGGMVAFCYKENTTAATYRDAIYAACIAAGGLKGNRASPKKAKGYTILKNFNAAGVLLECGFMDSKTDAPVILTEAYSKLIGYATMEGVAKAAGLKKQAAVKITKQPTSVSVKEGESFTISVTAEGEGLTYKWYYKEKGGDQFYLTNTFKGSTYSTTMNATRNGRQVYCVVTDKNGNTAKTDTVTMSMVESCTVALPVLTKGDKGEAVKAMQYLLIGHGFSCGEKGADGSFGSATDAAVRKYQKAKGLTQDGSCGPKTWAKLLGV